MYSIRFDSIQFHSIPFDSIRCDLICFDLIWFNDSFGNKILSYKTIDNKQPTINIEVKVFKVCVIGGGNLHKNMIGKCENYPKQNCNGWAVVWTCFRLKIIWWWSVQGKSAVWVTCFYWNDSSFFSPLFFDLVSNLNYYFQKKKKTKKMSVNIGNKLL